MARDESARKQLERGPLLDRRSYVRLAGLALGSLGAVRLSAMASATEPDIVDVVEAGADTTGRSSIDSVLAEHAADDTLFAFPDGDYLLNGFDATGLTNFGLVATGDAALIAPAGTQGDWLRLVDGRDITVRGMTFRTGATDAALTLRPDDGLSIHDCELTGWHAPGSRSTALTLGAQDAEGRAIVENLALRGPTDEHGSQVELPARLVLAGAIGRYRLSADEEGTTVEGDAAARGVAFDLPDRISSLHLTGPTNARLRLPSHVYDSARAAGTPATPNDVS